MMTTTSQAVLPLQTKSLRIQLCAITAILGFCTLFSSTAFANCRSVRGAFPQSITAPSAVFGKAAASAMAQPASQAATSNSKASASVAGLWYTTFSVDGQVIDQAFEQWHSDGTEILNDTSAPATDNVCLGVWEQTGTRVYKLYHPSWYFDLNGNLLGTVIIRETIHLNKDGDSFSGVGSDDVYDISGAFLAHTDGVVSGKRIKVH